MRKYLYLTDQWMATTWIEGGVVPVYVASTYQGRERSGTRAPDEVQQMDVSTDPGGYFDIDGGMSYKRSGPSESDCGRS